MSQAPGARVSAAPSATTRPLPFVRDADHQYDTQKDTLAFTAVDKFLPDHVYYHGCLKSFLQITKWRGPEVSYSEHKEEPISLCLAGLPTP